MVCTIALVLTLVVQNQVNAGAAGNFSSYIDGQRWDFVVSRDDIDASPRWLDAEDTHRSRHALQSDQLAFCWPNSWPMGINGGLDL